MAKELDEKLYDRRTIDRNINNGVIPTRDYERYLKSLGDDGANAVPMKTELGSSGHTPRTADSDEEV